MKKVIIIVIVGMIAMGTVCLGQSQVKNKANTVSQNNPLIEHLTNKSFKEKVFNYEVNKVWKYQGKLPCLIDFYADWCGPCRMLSPFVEQMASEYKGKIVVYKINVDQEQQLASAFGISSIPALLFCPMKDKPRMNVGYISQLELQNLIKTTLLK